MTRITGLLRRHNARLAAITVIAILFQATALPGLSADERARLASQFQFTHSPLPHVAGYEARTIRTVHPSLQRIAAWISSVGAAVALHDLDDDGLPNDVCYVDTRIDQVIVAPLPGTPARFAPFVLDAAPVGYDRARMAPMGCLPGDVNEDGRADLLVYYWGRTPVIFLQRGDTTSLAQATYLPQELVPGGLRWYTNAAMFADLDGDGHADLLVGNYFPDGAHILDANGPGAEHMQHSMSRANNGGAKHFFLWTGATSGDTPTVHFRNVDAGLNESLRHQWTLALAACDLDGDLLPEIYIANDFGPDRLLHNRSLPGQLHFVPLQGRKTLTTPNSKIVGHDSFKGMGIDCGDLNDDLMPDLFVSNIAAEYALEESHFAFLSTGDVAPMYDGIAPYVDQSESLGVSRSGWGWDAKIADFNNDGVPEIVQATGFVKGETDRWPELHEVAMGNDQLLSSPGSWPHLQQGVDLSGHQSNAFFVRARDGRFHDLAQDVGLGELSVTRGVATADVDGDGQLDVAIANQWEPSAFFRNTAERSGSFLGLHLQRSLTSPGPSVNIQPGHPQPASSGSPAIGATATVHLPDGRQLTGQVDGGNGHSGKRSPDLLFGLGALPQTTTIRVDLAWRAATGQIHRQTITVQPGWHTVLLN